MSIEPFTQAYVHYSTCARCGAFEAEQVNVDPNSDWKHTSTRVDLFGNGNPIPGIFVQRGEQIRPGMFIASGCTGVIECCSDNSMRQSDLPNRVAQIHSHIHLNKKRRTEESKEN
jgi:hypothetical protein